MAPPVGHRSVCFELKTVICGMRAIGAGVMLVKKIELFLNIIYIFQEPKLCAAMCITESQII